MMWGVIDQDQKSLLILLIKREGIREIYSKVYLEQVLEPVVFPWFNILSE